MLVLRMPGVSHSEGRHTHVEWLQEQLSERDAELSKLRSAHERLWQSYAELKHEMALLKRRMFVASAERVDTTELQLEFAELTKKLDALVGELPEPPSGDEPRAEKDKSSSGRDTGRGKSRGGRRNLAESDLPLERVELKDELFEQLVAEGKAERIGFEDSWELGYRRGGPVRIQKARVKYRTLPQDDRPAEIEIATLPPQLLPRCMAAPSMLAHLAAEKCHRGMPLYRLEKTLAEYGTPLDRGTMSRWVEQVGGAFNTTVVHAMDADARAHAFVQLTDSTGFPIQPGRFDRDGPRTRRPCRKGHYYVRIADRDSIVFEYVERNTSENVRAMFRGYGSYVQGDAASVFDALFRRGDPDDDGCERVEVGCWSHCRRKYWEAAFAKQILAREALLRIGKIFEVDARITQPKGRKRPPPAKIKALRDVHLRPLVDEMLAFAAVQYEEVKDERGTLRSALGYTVRQADALKAFLQDGRLRLDNNPSENALRKVVLLRDVSLFAGSDLHAQSQAGILSLVATACLHRLPVEPYLRDVIRVLPYWPREHYLLLAPKFWPRTRQLLPQEQLLADVGWLDIPDLTDFARALYAAQ